MTFQRCLPGKRRFQIEKAWIGRGPTVVKTYQGTGAAVHRFKVDEKAAFIVSTSDDGGLLVTDIESNEVVWSLNPVSMISVFKNWNLYVTESTTSFSATSIATHIANMEMGLFALTVSMVPSRSGVDLRTLIL